MYLIICGWCRNLSHWWIDGVENSVYSFNVYCIYSPENENQCFQFRERITFPHNFQCTTIKSAPKLQQVKAIKTFAFCFYWYFIHRKSFYSAQLLHEKRRRKFKAKKKPYNQQLSAQNRKLISERLELIDEFSLISSEN